MEEEVENQGNTTVTVKRKIKIKKKKKRKIGDKSVFVTNDEEGERFDPVAFGSQL